MIFLLFLSAIIILCFYNFCWKRRGLPPGPIPLPLIGNLIPVMLNPPGEDVYKSWKRKYGNVYTHWLGEHPVVTLNDYKLIKETFIKDADSYMDRVKFNDFYYSWKYGNWGVIITDGDLWKEQRRYAMMVLKDFGMGKNILQEKILLDVQTLIDDVKTEIDHGIIEHNISDHVDIAVGSVINSFILGYRYRGDKTHEFDYLKKAISVQMEHSGHPINMLMWKWMRHMKKLPYFSGIAKRMESNRDLLFKYFDEHIQEHKREIDLISSDEPKDYVEAFLREQHRREMDGDDGHYFNQIQLISMCFDLWLAGQETTSLTIAWAIVYLILNPDVQKKVHEELDEVIGSDRMVEENDRHMLKYTCSVINEAQRIANILPFSILRQTTKDVIIEGHFIPKGTSIVPQISVVLIDDQIFPEPKKFKPERFLDENNNLKKLEEFIPFSIGKHQCLGEGLAKMELYLFIANLCNQFEFYPIPGKEPTTRCKHGQTIGPYPYVCGIKKRKMGD